LATAIAIINYVRLTLPLRWAFAVSRQPYDYGSAKQVGFARVVSDLVRFSWLGDVFILPEYRGRGLSKWLMSVITEHPKLKGTGFQLATKDAHSLYAQYGFKPLGQIEDRMNRSLDWEVVYKGYKINK
jgi:GNAT superfamily N-acetyltransferase